MRRTFVPLLLSLGLSISTPLAAFADDAAPAASSVAATSTWGASTASVSTASSAAPASRPTVSMSASATAAAPSSPSPAATTGAFALRGHGVAVLAEDGATDSAWRLAIKLYRGALRPENLDEPRARALAGEAPKEGAPREVQDLYETRAAIHGDGAASKRLLSSIADSLGVEAIAVVAKDASGVPFARVYVAGNSSFDAARYTEDASAADPWQPAASSIERAFHVDVTPPAPARANPLVSDTPKKLEPVDPNAARPFYKSPWFWGALGAAAFATGAIFLATRGDSDGGPIHLQMKLP